jgi:hypothetical protein
MLKSFVLTLGLLVSVFVATIPTVAQEQPLPDVGSYSEDALTARLAALKDLYRINLTEKERQNVIENCEPAQVGLTKISAKLGATKTNRAKNYTSVIASLVGLRSLVFSKQVDTSNIELLTVEYQRTVEDFNQAIIAYQTTLDDAVQVDCSAKPEEFRAALEGVRAARKQVVSTSAQINEVTKSNLKTAFDTLKDRLDAGVQPDGK